MNTIAVDVGTASVRLAIISFKGEKYNEVNILDHEEKEISVHQDGVKFEQSSEEIWQAICYCSKTCLTRSNIETKTIKSIAFSATCSLVVPDRCSPHRKTKDVIMWMDHRAIAESQAITESGSSVLAQFGGICSPEFSLSKIIWLCNNDPERLQSASGLFELPDWLVYRCIGNDPTLVPRSLCCSVCKWGYDAKNSCHCDPIKVVSSKLTGKIGERQQGPGSVAGIMSEKASNELGLGFDEVEPICDKENKVRTDIVVGCSLIDAHAGMLGMLAVPFNDYGLNSNIESSLCTLAGTSTCNMLLSKSENFTKGVWGPYRNVILDGYHLLEAGQSLTGKLIEMSIEANNEGQALINNGMTIRDVIISLNAKLKQANYDSQLHVLPFFHGNRCPLANPRLRGGLYGMTVGDQTSLIDHYVATVESIVYETKMIVETLCVKPGTILVSGGLMKNEYFMQTLADALTCNVAKMALEQGDFMVLGSGIIARQAAINYSKQRHNQQIAESDILGMNVSQLVIKMYQPQNDRLRYHEKKYRCFKEFVDFSKRVDEIMHS